MVWQNWQIPDERALSLSANMNVMSVVSLCCWFWLSSEGQLCVGLWQSKFPDERALETMEIINETQ
jgi:hypothetical protein